MVDYSLRFNETPRDQILTMMRWAGERNDAKAKERKDEYLKLMQMLGRGYGALKANADYKARKEANALWDAYMPQAQEDYANELVGLIPSYDDTYANLQSLGLNPNLTDINKLRRIGADAEFEEPDDSYTSSDFIWG